MQKYSHNQQSKPEKGFPRIGGAHVKIMDTATLTVRFIRSFEHRNIKHVVFKDVDLGQTGHEFLSYVTDDLQRRTGIPPPVKKYAYDTLKIQHKAHGAKTTDPVINTETQELIDPHVSLRENGVENETEISCFKLEDYSRYKADPQKNW